MSKIGVITLNFGEPDEPTPEKVIPFLERIFMQNMGLEASDPEGAHRRANELARRRAPGLIEEYEEIGGSPLNDQADEHAAALERELRDRGLDVAVYSAFQFTAPFLDETVRRARQDGVSRLVALPVYPLCGHSTTVAALDAVERTLDELDWDVPFTGITGWHKHAAYLDLRVDHIRRFLEENDLDLQDPDTLLYFSAHGTPVKYLVDGSRYDRYVEEHCRDIAEALGAPDFAVGFQNHTNRGIQWTQPDNEDRIVELAATRLVVDPVSFVHEQSETLAELDHELREFIEEQGKVMYRVPVPHEHPDFPALLATLIQDAMATAGGASGLLAPCRCRPVARTFCTNGARDLPESPYLPRTAAGEAVT